MRIWLESVICKASDLTTMLFLQFTDERFKHDSSHLDMQSHFLVPKQLDSLLYSWEKGDNGLYDNKF